MQHVRQFAESLPFGRLTAIECKSQQEIANEDHWLDRLNELGEHGTLLYVAE
jgi:hypothetical protein